MLFVLCASRQGIPSACLAQASRQFHRGRHPLWVDSGAAPVSLIDNDAAIPAAQKLVDRLHCTRTTRPCETKPIFRGHLPSDLAPSDGYSRSFSSTQAFPLHRAEGSCNSSFSSPCHCCSRDFGAEPGWGRLRVIQGDQQCGHGELNRLPKADLICKYEACSTKPMPLKCEASKVLLVWPEP